MDEKIVKGLEVPPPPPPPIISATADNPPAQATTTSEQDLKTKGQRRVNLIWEVTQAVIATLISSATIYAVFRQIDSTILSNAFTLIIALYFVRQNHIKVGGVGGTDTR